MCFSARAAIENGAFVIAPAQGGLHANGRRTFGHSLIVAPWGEILAEAGTEPCVITAMVDPEAVAEARARPALGMIAYSASPDRRLALPVPDCCGTAGLPPSSMIDFASPERLRVIVYESSMFQGAWL